MSKASSKNLPGDLELGKQSSFPSKLTSDILDPIERDKIDKPSPWGLDIWYCFEFLHQIEGVSKLAWLVISLPSKSKNIVESKSLKLYLSTFFNHDLNSKQAIIDRIYKDLSERLELAPEISREVSLELIDPGETQNSPWKRDLNVVQVDNFRSLCPVTSQPDYASVVVTTSNSSEFGQKELTELLDRHQNSQAFHEACADQIFLDLGAELQSTDFALGMFFSRRGGISISPIRATTEALGLRVREAMDYFRFYR